MDVKDHLHHRRGDHAVRFSGACGWRDCVERPAPSSLRLGPMAHASSSSRISLQEGFHRGSGTTSAPRGRISRAGAGGRVRLGLEAFRRPDRRLRQGRPPRQRYAHPQTPAPQPCPSSCLVSLTACPSIAASSWRRRSLEVGTRTGRSLVARFTVAGYGSSPAALAPAPAQTFGVD